MLIIVENSQIFLKFNLNLITYQKIFLIAIFLASKMFKEHLKELRLVITNCTRFQKWPTILQHLKVL